MKKNWLDGVDSVSLVANANTWSGWIETFLLTVIAVAVSYVTQPQDPFRIHSGFPWAMIGPLLVGLRYGFAQGFVSALLVLAALGVAINWGWQTANEFPLSWSVGVVVVAMISGEFRDVWERRLTRLAGTNEYRAERLEEFSRSFHLLRASHDRLEQTIANSGLSLREGIMRLQSTLHAVNGLSAETWQKLLELLSEFGSLEQACICEVKDGNASSSHIVASIGDRFEWSMDDNVIRYALEQNELAAVNRVGLSQANNGVLLALPLTDCSGVTHGLLLVKQMPFFAFHESTLKLLSVIGAHSVDHLRRGAATTSGTRFIFAVERVQQDFQQFNLPSMLLKFSGSHKQVMSVYEHIKPSLRALDMYCLDRMGDEMQLWILLPLTDSLGARQFMQRHGEAIDNTPNQVLEIVDVDVELIRHLETR